MWRYCARQGRSARVDARVSRLRQRAMGGGGWSDNGGRKSMCPKARPCHGTSQAEGSAQDAEVARAQKVCWAMGRVTAPSSSTARDRCGWAAGNMAVVRGSLVEGATERRACIHTCIHTPICDVRRTAKDFWARVRMDVALSMCTVYRQLDRLHGTVVLTYDSVLSHVGYARAFWCHGCTCSKEGTVCDRAPRLTTLSMRTRQLRRRYVGSVCSPSPG